MLGFAGIVGVFVWRGMADGFFDVSYFGYPLNPTYGLSEKNGRGNRAPTVPLFGGLIPLGLLEAGALCAPYKCTKSS